jgi:hypothetical protein
MKLQLNNDALLSITANLINIVNSTAVNCYRYNLFELFRI